MYWWRAVFKYGNEECWVDGIINHRTLEDAETEAREIDNSIGIEDYARAKGVDLSKWKFNAIYVVRYVDQ